jgi:hypothetical protein
LAKWQLQMLRLLPPFAHNLQEFGEDWERPSRILAPRESREAIERPSRTVRRVQSSIASRLGHYLFGSQPFAVSLVPAAFNDPSRTDDTRSIDPIWSTQQTMAELSPKMSEDTTTSRRSGFLSRAYLMADVNPDLSTVPLAAYCFMTGFMYVLFSCSSEMKSFYNIRFSSFSDVVCFSAIFVWCGFQTGNTLQLGLALARLFQDGGRDTHFHIADRQALCSVLTFLGGMWS